MGSGALGAGFNLERHLLSAKEGVEVDQTVDAAAVEEVFLPVVCGDESEASLRYELLDSASGHISVLFLEPLQTLTSGQFEQGPKRRSHRVGGIYQAYPIVSF